MSKLACPHCRGYPITGLGKFLPLTRLVREEFTCSICGGKSVFSRGSYWRAAVAGLSFCVITALGLATWVHYSPLGTRSVSMPIGLAYFVAFMTSFNLVSALTLRRFASLTPIPPVST